MMRGQRLLLCVSLALGACDSATKDAEPKSTASAAPVEKVALPDAAGLLAEVVEAEGGAAKWSALKTFRAETAIEVPGSALSGTGKMWWKEGDFYQELSIPGVGLSFVGKKGPKIWSIDPIQGSREISGKEAATYEMASSPNIAGDWKKYFDSAVTKSLTESDGQKFAEITLSSAKTGLSIDLKIDLQDKRIVMRRVMQTTPLGDIPVEETLEDYRQQDGLWFSFKQTADMKLQKMVTKTTKLELDVPVDETKFSQPGPPAIDPTVIALPTDGKADAKAPADTKTPADAKPAPKGSKDAATVDPQASGTK